MKSKILVLIILTLILIIFSYFIDNKFYNDQSKNEFNLKDNNISLLIANTDELRQKGLGSVDYLPQNTAMLFIFNEMENHGIWMKDMKFSLDIIWLDDKKKIIHIEENISPNTYPTLFGPERNSLYIIEANAGFSRKNAFKVGKVLNF